LAPGLHHVRDNDELVAGALPGVISGMLQMKNQTAAIIDAQKRSAITG
jgi:hypothetical protein